MPPSFHSKPNRTAILRKLQDGNYVWLTPNENNKLSGILINTKFLASPKGKPQRAHKKPKGK